MLEIKRFVQGKDEANWVRVWNAAFKEYDDLRQMTVDEYKIAVNAPEFDREGRFIAELDGQSVGIIHAYVDKLREDRKGFVRFFGVVPEFRSRGIDEKLAETGLKELKKRGMKVAQAWATSTREDRIRLWENWGFKLVRKFSMMKRDLDEMPSKIGENEEVVLKRLRKDSDEDVKMLFCLDTECFREHFNYRPGTIEQTTYFVRNDPFFKDQAWFFATLNKENVGYIGIGIDEKYNTERNVKSGWILDIGVLKSYRREGIGTRLMLQGMQILKTKGMTTVMLGVDDWNVTKAMKLYEKVGFVVSKKDFTFEKEFLEP